MIIDGIDTSDIPEITDFSRARPNPYAEKIRKHGFSITVHYSPEDVSKMTQDTLDRINNFNLLELDEEELAALERYKERQKQR